MGSLWIPRELKVAPYLDPDIRPRPMRPRYALLLNPFYPKDPHASFGKHVLTPSLALTSIGFGVAADTVGEFDRRTSTPSSSALRSCRLISEAVRCSTSI